MGYGSSHSPYWPSWQRVACNAVLDVPTLPIDAVLCLPQDKELERLKQEPIDAVLCLPQDKELERLKQELRQAVKEGIKNGTVKIEYDQHATPRPKQPPNAPTVQ